MGGRLGYRIGMPMNIRHLPNRNTVAQHKCLSACRRIPKANPGKFLLKSFLLKIQAA
jgi:hypothetical protein